GRRRDGGRRLRPQGPRASVRGVTVRHSTDESFEQLSRGPFFGVHLDPCELSTPLHKRATNEAQRSSVELRSLVEGVSFWGIQLSPSKIVSRISTPPLLSKVFPDCGRQNIN